MSAFDPIKKPLKRGLVAAGLATTLITSQASADAERFFDAGAFIGYSWGRSGGFTWGLEARLGRLMEHDYGDPAPAIAGTFRFGFSHGVQWPQLSLGVQGGVMIAPIAVMGDLSLGYRFGEDGGLQLPVGIDLQAAMLNTFFRFDPMLLNGTVGGGARGPGLYQQMDSNPSCLTGCVVEGRILHSEEGRADLPSFRLREEPRGELSERLVQAWGMRARTEWASVPAFVQLAQQLAQVKAPVGLIRRALIAAEDERRHAYGAANIAGHFSGGPVELGAVSSETRQHAEGLAGLQRLAKESWLDGCIGEGIAARCAEAEIGRTEVEAIQTCRRDIAVEEQQHAELAWDILEWTLHAGGDEVRDALWSVREGAEGAEGAEGELVPEDDELSEFGVLPDRERISLTEEVREAATKRLAPLLA